MTTTAPMTMHAAARIRISHLLVDRYGDRLGEHVELALASLDPELPVAGDRQLRPPDHERAVLAGRLGFEPQRADACARQGRGDAGLVDLDGLAVGVLEL